MPSTKPAAAHFRLSEREHEDTVLTGAVLKVTYVDGEVQSFVHQNAAVDLSIGESVELDFELPAELIARAELSSLTLSGYYQEFGPERVAAMAASLAA